jgi:hypothetical protein
MVQASLAAPIPLIDGPDFRDHDIPLGVEPGTRDPGARTFLYGARLIAWQRRLRTQAQLEELLARRGINPVFVHRTDDNLSLQRLVAVGLGHACVSRIAARNACDSLTWLEPREELVRRQLALCYPRVREVSGAVMALAAAVRAQTNP